jgi:hypothetical protein
MKKASQPKVTLANTEDTRAKIQALKNVPATQWVGTTVHPNLDFCMRAISMGSFNSGWYNPIAVKIDGLQGYFMVNQDGSIFADARVIKESENQFKIEYMSNQGSRDFYREYENAL